MKVIKKLKIHKENVRKLSNFEMENVDGGIDVIIGGTAVCLYEKHTRCVGPCWVSNVGPIKI